MEQISIPIIVLFNLGGSTTEMNLIEKRKLVQNMNITPVHTNMNPFKKQYIRAKKL